MDPNVEDIHAGVAGVVLEPKSFELGQGVRISQTYAHFMAPFLMAFAPAPQGKPHPAPWKAAKGGYSQDVSAELFLPANVRLSCVDRLNTVWWIIALLRLKATTQAFVPVLSSEQFSSIPTVQQEPEILPMEIYLHRILPERELDPVVRSTHLEWLKSHWEEGSVLLANEDFATAIQAIDFSMWGTSPSLALVAVWGALERLFSSSNTELGFRVSANLASYLESPGKQRHKLFKRIRGLYDSRSKAAHGVGQADAAPYKETFAIARSAILRMIETCHVPGKQELEAGLFGDAIRTVTESEIIQ